ncbi:hypothetical protein BVRB_6g143160 [Beta vulgaris subsp. vulgaris]|nr:hypothetical protein BVRB_6g143160 [Beta vulgaris subsp. vulgaris]
MAQLIPLPHPLALTYCRPLGQLQPPEIDLNTTTFFLVTDNGLSWRRVTPNLLYHTLENNRATFLGFHNGLMIMEDGTERPPHLPLFEDLQGIHGAFEYIMWVMGKLRDQGSSRLIPQELMHILDPRPVMDPRNVPTYMMPFDRSHVFMASYTDGLHIMEVNVVAHAICFSLSHLRSWFRWRCYHLISFYQCVIDYPPNQTVLNLGSKIVIWNARGLTRPSFEGNFRILYDVLRPLIVILTETRISMRNMVALCARLPGEYEFEMYGEGCYEGVVILYNQNMLSPRFIDDDMLDGGVMFSVILRYSYN